MTDREIIALLLRRDEYALGVLEEKYGAYCRAVAMRILNNDSDAEECVNDALYAAWNSIPPHKPDDLGAYMSALTRNISVVRLEKIKAAKRGGGETDLVIDELEDFFADTDTPESVMLTKEFAGLIERFLRSLPKRERNVFLSRYYYAHTYAQIASAFGISDNHIRAILSRTRKKLKAFLSKEDML